MGLRRFILSLCARVTVILLIVLSAAAGAAGQPEIVPAEHPVYDYLHQQRVAGRLPEYRHELRPAGRAQLQVLLDSLDSRRTRLGSTSRYWLNEFLREFYEPADQIEQVFENGRIHVPAGRDTEKFFYYHRSDDWRFAIRARGAIQHRQARSSADFGGLALVPELRFEGNYRDLVGFYSGTWNGLQITGDTRVLQQDPVLAPIYYIGRQEVPPGNFDRTTASLRVAGRHLSAEIAHARLMVGASFREPLILAGRSDYFPYVRLGLDSRVVQYHFVHGALGDRSRCVFSEENPENCVFVGPDRFLAMHRLTVNPASWASFAFSEMVVYGQRGPELAYLNPVIPLKPAEHALWDRDSALFTLEGVLRPLRPLEFYGTWLVDDLDLSLINEGSYNNKWAFQGGIGTSLGSVLLWGEYTRVEPFVYTHRFELDGSFYNTYHHNGFPLGYSTGPNTDQVAAGIKIWLPIRLQVAADLRYARHGRNYHLVTGELVNVGGDLMDGRIPGFHVFTKQFLAGALYAGPGATLSIAFEPIRSIVFRAYAETQRWEFKEMRGLRGEPSPPVSAVDLPYQRLNQFFLRTSVSVEW